MQEPWVWSLVQEDPTCLRATKPTSHNSWSCALETGNHNYWAHVLQLLKPVSPRVGASQQEKPWKWEGPCTATREEPQGAVTTEKPMWQQRPSMAKNKWINYIILRKDDVVLTRGRINRETEWNREPRHRIINVCIVEFWDSWCCRAVG